jgi:hypothetical protein
MKSKHCLDFLVSALLLAGLFTFNSCEKNVPASNTSAKPSYGTIIDTAFHLDTNFISMVDARQFAERITPEVFQNGENKTVIRNIVSSFKLKDSKGQPAIYVFNYENSGGYVVMSADYRYEAICAFVETGNLSSSADLPAALACWFGATVEDIEGLRKGNLFDDGGGRYSWAILAGKLELEYNPPYYGSVVLSFADRDCGNYQYYYKNALLKTTWDQTCGYNDQIPVTGCSEDCGRAPTGCVAVVGAQLLRYWAKPSPFNYAYATMPNSQGNSEIQRMMLNVGQLVNMDWNCVNPDGSGGSGAVTEDLHNVFQTYHYYTAPGNYDDYENSSRWILKSDIDAGRPVVMDGCTDQQVIFGFKIKRGRCHAWLCDGYRVELSNCIAGRFHFSMNWGWGGAFNGFYYQTNHWPAERAYRYCNSIMHNIHP